jgi:hypothetical protein
MTDTIMTRENLNSLPIFEERKLSSPRRKHNRSLIKERLNIDKENND